MEAFSAVLLRAAADLRFEPLDLGLLRAVDFTEQSRLTPDHRCDVLRETGQDEGPGHSQTFGFVLADPAAH